MVLRNEEDTHGPRQTTVRHHPQAAVGRYQARYTGPHGRRASRRTPSARGSTPRAGCVNVAASIDAGRWNPTAVAKPAKVTFGAYAAALAGRPPRRRPADQDHAPASTTRPSSTTTCCRRSEPPAGGDHAEGCAGLVRRDAGRPPHDARRTPTACCAPSWQSAVNDELIDANPCRIVGAGRAKRRPQDQARIASTSWPCSPRRCPNGCS